MKVQQIATVLCLCVAIGLSGCISKKAAQAEAQRAYWAGQREALARLDGEQQLRVVVVGPVLTPSVPWTPELTVARAILSAQYTSQQEPTRIVVERVGERMQITPEELLNGSDILLQPGDVIRLFNERETPKP